MTDGSTSGAPKPAPSGRQIAIRFALIAAMAVLAGAGLWRYQAVQAARLSDEAALCELLIVGALEAPSTYRRVEALRSDNADASSKLPIVQTFVTFEAPNPMGVGLRHLGYCEFWRGPDGGSWRLKQAEIDGEPIAEEPMLTILAVKADGELMKRRQHESTLWGALGF